MQNTFPWSLIETTVHSIPIPALIWKPGTTHAIYPARNPYQEDLDNLQPLQYQGTPYPIGANGECRVCHTIDMADEIHHPNMLGEFRNTR